MLSGEGTDGVREPQAGLTTSLLQVGVSEVGQLALFPGGTAGTQPSWFSSSSLLPCSGAEPSSFSSLTVTPFL